MTNQKTNLELIDGKQYDLGASIGTWDENRGVFVLGNTFVYRENTVYSESREPSVRRYYFQRSCSLK